MVGGHCLDALEHLRRDGASPSNLGRDDGGRSVNGDGEGKNYGNALAEKVVMIGVSRLHDVTEPNRQTG